MLRIAMAKDPRQRFASAADVAAALTAPEPLPSARAALAAPPARRRRRRRALAVGVPVVAGVTALTLALTLRPWADDADPSATGGERDAPAAREPAPAPYDGPVAFDLDGNGFGDLVAFDGDEAPGFGVTYYSDGTSLTRRPRTDPERRLASAWGDIAPGTRGLEQVSIVYRGSLSEDRRAGDRRCRAHTQHPADLDRVSTLPAVWTS
ncbi:hypothetical protein G5V59_08630 [Nocardioides sp. W3-2-3]|uniref:hypothetical protein n=1 Tax=Nocardioides convexus TaxID=2712224 RepID=UPI0024181D9E|nr:hypothetical protein [Nocardioides convexus]NHA00180.1 hypothetical protein [Nocardioides convexus]